MQIDNEELRELLVSAYTGEVFGEALFGALRGRWDDPGVDGHLVAMEALEREMGARMGVLLDDLDIGSAPTAAARESGVSQASALAETTWAGFLEMFEAGTAGVLARYQRIEELAPASIGSTVALLIDHERALAAFASAELAASPGSIEPVVRVIERLRAASVC